MEKIAAFLRKFIRLNRFELIALAIVLALALVSGVSYFSFDKITQPKGKSVVVKGEKIKKEGEESREGKKPNTPSSNNSKNETGSSSSSSKTGKSSSSNSPQNSSGTQTDYISVELTIDTGATRNTYSVRIEKGSTVYELLRQASAKYGFSLDTSYNSSYGVFIEEIAGVRNSAELNKYWLYYVNGKFASVGASSKKLYEGDRVLWKYQIPS